MIYSVKFEHFKNLILEMSNLEQKVINRVLEEVKFLIDDYKTFRKTGLLYFVINNTMKRKRDYRFKMLTFELNRSLGIQITNLFILGADPKDNKFNLFLSYAKENIKTIIKCLDLINKKIKADLIKKDYSIFRKEIENILEAYMKFYQNNEKDFKMFKEFRNKYYAHSTKGIDEKTRAEYDFNNLDYLQYECIEQANILFKSTLKLYSTFHSNPAYMYIFLLNDIESNIVIETFQTLDAMGIARFALKYKPLMKTLDESGYNISANIKEIHKSLKDK